MMKAKDRRRLERQAEEIRKESGLTSTQDIRRLIASSDTIRQIIMDTARKTEPRQQAGPDTGG